jgi:hypothetical protein
VNHGQHSALQKDQECCRDLESAQKCLLMYIMVVHNGLILHLFGLQRIQVILHLSVVKPHSNPHNSTIRIEYLGNFRNMLINVINQKVLGTQLETLSKTLVAAKTCLIKLEEYKMLSMINRILQWVKNPQNPRPFSSLKDVG